MTTQTIDCTPSWTGILRLLLTIYTDSSAKGRQTALEEMTKMAVLADRYVEQAKAKLAPEPSILTDDTTRVEAAIAYLADYNDGLDAKHLSPNGDDYNRLSDGVFSILNDGVVRDISLTSEGR